MIKIKTYELIMLIESYYDFSNKVEWKMGLLFLVVKISKKKEYYLINSASLFTFLILSTKLCIFAVFAYDRISPYSLQFCLMINYFVMTAWPVVFCVSGCPWQIIVRATYSIINDAIKRANVYVYLKNKQQLKSFGECFNKYISCYLLLPHLHFP